MSKKSGKAKGKCFKIAGTIRVQTEHSDGAPARRAKVFLAARRGALGHVVGERAPAGRRRPARDRGEALGEGAGGEREAHHLTDTMFFMVRAHGQDQIEAVVELLTSLDVTISEEPAGTFDVSEYAAAFLYDANGEGVAATLEGFRNRYAGHFGDLSNLEHGRWVTETTIPVGCFVFHKTAQDTTGCRTWSRPSTGRGRHAASSTFRDFRCSATRPRISTAPSGRSTRTR